MLAIGSPISWLQEPEDQLWHPCVPNRYDLNATSMPPGLDHWWIDNSAQFSITDFGIITNITMLDDGVYPLNVFVWDTLGMALHAEFTITVSNTTPVTTTTTYTTESASTTVTETSTLTSITTTVSTTTEPTSTPPDMSGIILLIIATAGVVVVIVVIVMIKRKRT